MKHTIRKKLLLIATVALSGCVLMAFVNPLQDGKAKKWDVPDASKNAANPKKGDKASVTNGQALYEKFCKSCHGAKGLGDGSKAKTLDTKCGDFSSKDFQSQTDGALFYKTKEGRDEMPAYKKKITDDNDIWSIVNYLRTFAK